MQNQTPIHLTLQRTGQVGVAMMGTLTATGADIGKLHTLEHRWRNNAPQVSCIPAGTYTFVPHGWEPSSGKKFKRVWRLENVPGRDAILIHAGNTVHDTEGCILVGQAASGAFVGNSQKALEFMRHAIGPRTGTITVLDPVAE